MVRTLNVRLFRSAPLGSSPNALALTPRQQDACMWPTAQTTLWPSWTRDSAANPVRGFIPTGWYPTAVALERATGGSCASPAATALARIAPLAGGRTGRSYQDRVGVVSILDVPTPAQLAAFSAQVRLNNHAEQTPRAAR